MSERIVLFVDDEDDVLTNLEALFDNQPLQPMTCNNPEEALALLENQDIAVLVSDQEMPTMTGLELLAKAQEIAPGTIRIILTGQTDKSLVVDAINVGHIYQFFYKTDDPDILVKRVLEAVEYYDEVHAAQDMISLRKHYSTDSELEILTTQVQEKDAELSMILAENEAYSKKSQDNFRAIMITLVLFIQLKDKDLHNSGQWISKFSVRIGKKLNMASSELSRLQIAGYLKNLGLLAMPDKFTEKTLSMFDRNELQQYLRYPAITEQLLTRLPGFAKIGAQISNVLERHDGSGPKGLVEDQIPEAAQVLGLADDAYRILFTKSVHTGLEGVYGKTFLINHLRKNMGKLYSAKLVHAAISVLGKETDPVKPKTT